MKRSFLYVIFSLFLLLLPIGQTTANSNDSIRLSLLTCAPGEVIYTLFGHTAIRYENPSQGIDVVFNYGLFSFDIPNFALRFSLGETDYRLGVIDYPHFAGEYAYFGRSVWQQTLNLNNEEKAELIRLLQENYRPENRVYRYNFFYDNCATRPRDKIEESIAGKVIYPVEPQDGSRTFREIVHQYCKGHPWARFGIDLCIGSEADRPITQRQMMFAPFYLMDAFAGAQITGDSIQRPLVTDSEQVAFITSGQQYTWPGIGGLTRINTELLWTYDRFSLSGGAFGGRYFTPFNPSPQFMGGFNAMASYDVTDWMTVRGWGQYTFYDHNERNNPHMLMNPFYNHTNVGGAFEFKVNDSGFRVGVGVNYEYNPIRGKMERQFMFYPAGKIGMFRIGN